MKKYIYTYIYNYTLILLVFTGSRNQHKPTYGGP